MQCATCNAYHARQILHFEVISVNCGEVCTLVFNGGCMFGRCLVLGESSITSYLTTGMGLESPFSKVQPIRTRLSSPVDNISFLSVTKDEQEDKDNPFFLIMVDIQIINTDS